jgi:hypothetical protein
MNRRKFVSVVGASVAGGAVAACSKQGEAPALPTPPSPLTYDASVRAIRAIIAQDAADATLEHDALPRLYVHGAAVANAVILFHGFTNCPQQFDLLARRFYATHLPTYRALAGA